MTDRTNKQPYPLAGIHISTIFYAEHIQLVAFSYCFPCLCGFHVHLCEHASNNKFLLSRFDSNGINSHVLLTSSSTSLSVFACVLQDGGSSGLLPGDTFKTSVSVTSDTSALNVADSD